MLNILKEIIIFIATLVCGVIGCIIFTGAIFCGLICGLIKIIDLSTSDAVNRAASKIFGEEE